MLITSFGLSTAFLTAAVNFSENSSIGPISSMATASRFSAALMMASAPTLCKSFRFTRYLPSFGPIFWFTCASHPLLPLFTFKIWKPTRVPFERVSRLIMPPTVYPSRLSASMIRSRTVVFPMPGLPVSISRRFCKSFCS